MHEAYTYATVGGLDEARAVAGELTARGAVVTGLWAGAGGIGWWDDEAVVLAGWPATAAPDATAGETLRATARPVEVAPIEPGGVFAHRWFEIDAGDWDEFLELSTGAWPAFEEAYDARIEGFFRSEDVEPPDARVLLITRYPSYEAWERSRGVGRDAGAGVVESGRRFLRRRELTKRSIVRLAALRSRDTARSS